MTTDQPVSIIRAVLKPGVSPDSSDLTANEIITELRRAGYLIVPAAPHPEHVSTALLREAAGHDDPDPGYCDDCGRSLSGPHCNSD